MAKTRSMTRNQNHDHDDDASSSSSKKRSKTFDKGDDEPGSDVNHEALLLVMMQLGVVDFIAFTGVCKSWRSLALSNRNWFMASRPPMKIWSTNDGYCCPEDFEKRRFKSILPHSAGRKCIGLTCGYLILFGRETRDFWLVNPITRHELHFPDYPLNVGGHEEVSAILVFSPSISGWVLVLHTTMSRWRPGKPKLSFYIEGKQRWNHVSSTVPIVDLHFFKGKIYTLHTDCSVRELRLYPNRKRKWALLETKNFPKLDLSFPEFVSSGENLYAISLYSKPKKVMELDIGKMKWVMPEKTIEEHAFSIGTFNKSSAAMKLESWAGPQTRFESYGHFLGDDKTQKWMVYYKGMWYFPHDCLTVNILDE